MEQMNFKESKEKDLSMSDGNEIFLDPEFKKEVEGLASTLILGKKESCEIPNSGGQILVLWATADSEYITATAKDLLTVKGREKITTSFSDSKGADFVIFS